MIELILVFLVLALVVAGLVFYQRIKERPYDKELRGKAIRAGVIGAALIGVMLLATQFYLFVRPGKSFVAFNWFTKSYSVKDEGFHILLRPLYELTEYNIRKQQYTMSKDVPEGAVRRADAVGVLSNDNLRMDVDVTLLYRYDPENLTKLHSEIAEANQTPEQKIIRPKTRNELRDVFAEYEATVAAASKRQEIQDKVESSLDEFFEENYINLIDVQIRDIRLPDQVRASIEEKKQEQQAAEKMQYTIQRRQKEKEAERLKGEAEAARKRAAAEGEADAIRTINQELQNSPLYIKWKGIDKLNPNAKIVIADGQTILDLGQLEENQQGG